MPYLYCSLQGNSGSPGRKTSSLIVKVAGGPRRPRMCEIPLGCALWIPEKLARVLYSQGSHFFEKPSRSKSSSPTRLREQKDSLCMHGGPQSPLRLLEERARMEREDRDDGSDGRPSCKCSDSLRRSVDSASSMPSSARRRGRSSDSRRRHGEFPFYADATCVGCFIFQPSLPRHRECQLGRLVRGGKTFTEFSSTFGELQFEG